MNPPRQEELVRIQRRILSVSQNYVKPGGVLIYSTCTIGADENQNNLKWFLEYFPYRLESIDPYICEELRSATTRGGFIQLLPGVHQSDGFFIARLRRLETAKPLHGRSLMNMPAMLHSAAHRSISRMALFSLLIGSQPPS